MTDPVVLALRAALGSGENGEIRCALGERLLLLGQPSEALVEFEAALVASPSLAAALMGAEKAATALGDEARANAYRLAAASRAPAAAAPSPALEEHRPAGKLRLVGDEEAEAPPPLTFADVAGMVEVKARLNRSFLLPLRNPELVRGFGGGARGGLIMYGAPGCGKTYLARALAGEISARLIAIALPDVLDMWLGESERKLHELFENARRQAPAVLFFDEIDALGQRRSQLRGSAGRNIVNQLLSEMDGFGGRNDGLYFLAATNHPWDIDSALRRPGRFDRMAFVAPPDAPARATLFELQLASLPKAKDVDISAVTKLTDGFSGADVAGVVRAATELALEESVAAGKQLPVSQAMLRRAIKDARPSTRAWFETARNHAIYANEGGVYDDLLAHLKAIGLA
jgi:SpoVK/Ycf46/Vps4 family AAA+-type ATPase